MVKQSARLDPGTEVSVYIFVKNKRRSCAAVWISCWRCTVPHFFPALISGCASQSLWKCDKGTGLECVRVCIVSLEKILSFH